VNGKRSVSDIFLVSLIRFDGGSCEFESLTGNAIYRRTYGPLDRPDSNSDSPTEGLQPPLRSRINLGIESTRGAICLKFISGSDCVRHADEFVIQLRDAGNPELLVERGTEVRVRARFDHIRNETQCVRFLVCIFMCNNRVLYVNIQASSFGAGPTMRHSRLGRRVLIPRSGLHNRINVGHG